MAIVIIVIAALACCTWRAPPRAPPPLPAARNAPSLYYTYGRGGTGQSALPGGFRVGHRL